MADALFDTTVFINYFNGDPAARDLLHPVLAGATTAAVSAVSWFEIWLGLRDHEEQMDFQGILGACEQAPLTNDVACLAAEWLRGISPRRAEALFRDALIGANAAERGEPVVTRNTTDFNRFGVNVRSY